MTLLTAFECRLPSSRARIPPRLYALFPLLSIPTSNAQGQSVPWGLWECQGHVALPNCWLQWLQKRKGGDGEQCHILKESAQGTSSPKRHTWRDLGGHLRASLLLQRTKWRPQPGGEVPAYRTSDHPVDHLGCSEALHRRPDTGIGNGLKSSPPLTCCIRVSPSPGLQAVALQRSHM